jgi:purine nucleosidase
MKREEILSRLGYKVPQSKKKRVIVHADIRNEADDQYAIMQHLLTPSEEIKGIIAGHFEWIAASLIPKVAAEQGVSTEVFENMIRNKHAVPDIFTPRGESMELSYEEGLKILKLAEVDDILILRGSKYELPDNNNLPESEGADFIIQEAMEDDERPLYIALQGCLTDLAIAYLKKPKIAEKVIAIWIGGGSYPNGGDEFNLLQDVMAARIVFESHIQLWQIPVNVYKTMEISFAELVEKVKPCGKIGKYICEQMFALNDKSGEIPVKDWPHGETWCLGDNPTVSVLLQSAQRQCWHTEKAPYINDDLTYSMNDKGREIRVYDEVDTRLTTGDMFAKLKLCYGTESMDR